MVNRRFGLILLCLGLILAPVPAAVAGQAAATAVQPAADAGMTARLHQISSAETFQYVEALCDPKFGGRLTGTAEYNACAEWVAGLLKEWGWRPGGDGGTYFQEYPNPYTLVRSRGRLILHLPAGQGGTVEKPYRFEDDYFPGSTSGSGTVTAEVIYAGYGITAPELGYDDYAGLDVKGKIVAVEVEAPVSPDAGAEAFLKWRPYSLHTYKVTNALKHGAAGMLYHYHITNPNCAYLPELVLTYVSRTVMEDLFAGTGRKWGDTAAGIRKSLKPDSFATGKTVTLENRTEHHQEGTGRSVFGWREGTDPLLQDSPIVLSGHLDFLGSAPDLMAGANDNASAVAVILAAARALAERPPLPRPVVLAFFGSEEQGVKGSEYYLQHLLPPAGKILACLNLDGTGMGEEIYGTAGKNFPWLWKYIEEANRRFVHRELKASHFANLGRPRLDAARFLSAGIPSISFATGGGKPLGYPVYHTTKDRPGLLNPEIMRDLARILFVAVTNLAAHPAVSPGNAE